MARPPPCRGLPAGPRGQGDREDRLLETDLRRHAARGGRRGSWPAARGDFRDPRPAAREALPQVRRLHRRPRERSPHHERRSRDLLLVPGKQGGPGPAPTRKGHCGRRADRAVRQGDRAPDRLDRPSSARDGRRRARAAARGRPAAAPAGAAGDGSEPARHPRQRATARVPSAHGHGGQPGRLLQRSEVHRGEGRQDLLQPRLLPQGIRALHDGLDAERRRHPWGDRGRAQPQVHLGCRLPDQDRQGGARLRGRLRGTAHRPSGHQPRAQEERLLRPRSGQGRPRRARGDGGRGSGDRPRLPGSPGPDGVRARRHARLVRSSSSSRSRRPSRASAPRSCGRPF